MYLEEYLNNLNEGVLNLYDSDNFEPMVIISTMGRVGNQLFEYSAAYSLAKQTNSKLYLFIDDETQKTILNFNIPEENIIYSNQYSKEFFNLLFSNLDAGRMSYHGKEINLLKVNDNNFFEIAKQKNNNKILVMNDYFQSPILFNEYKQELLDHFKITSVSEIKLSPLIASLIKENSVCVHFRKGDTENYSWYKTSIKYYTQSIQLSEKLVHNPKFYIFSDEISKVKNELKDIDNYESYNFQYIEGYSPIEDLYLMSNCGNNIIARSSFSWWAAYLNQNEGFVIAPYKPYHDELFDIFSPDEVDSKRALYDKYYPNNWILLDERE